MKHLKVTHKMIAKDMRMKAVLLRLLIRLNNKKKFQRYQNLLRKRLVGKHSEDPLISTEEKYISCSDGHKIRICIYRPKNFSSQSQATGLLWLHGGGYALGVPELEVPTIEQFIHASDTVVISPDYRLSLEKPFPAALNDAYDSLLWLKNNAIKLNVNPNQIFIGGESAGGGLACCLSAYARDKGEVQIAYQMPLYPMLDDRMQTDSMQNNNAPVWNAVSNKIAWELYLNGDQQKSTPSPYAAPARLKDYRNLPPTFTFVGSIEPFRDEVLTYVRNLKAANVPAEVKVYKGAFHAFDRLAPKSQAAKSATHSMLEQYKKATEKYFKQQRI